MKLFLFVAGLLSLQLAVRAEPYEVVIRHGTIIDGTGKPAYSADVAVDQGHIVKIGTILEKGKTEIDASGRIVSPGFIDVHTHADNIARYPWAENFLRMGVTSLVLGNCGNSALDIGNLFKEIETNHITLNVESLIGHNTVREAAMGGIFNRAPTQEEMTKMKSYIDQAMRDGAVGFSTGLIYQPGVFSTTDEIVELAKAITPYDGIYASHMRYENARIYKALDEVFRVAKEAHIRAEISHIKLAGEPAWGQAHQVLDYIQKARTQGLSLTDDQYSYTASSTTMSQLIPDEAIVKGVEVFNRIINDPVKKTALVDQMKAQLKRNGRNDYTYAVIASFKHNPTLNGLSIPQAAVKQYGSQSLEKQINVIFDLYRFGGASGVFHGINETDLKVFMADPNTMIASDSGIREFGRDVPHPRGYGNNARVLGHYVRELNLLSLEDAIRKMTSLPAHTFKFEKRGEIKEGNWADIIIFDRETINSLATYEDPHHYAVGVDDVLVNGVFVIQGEKLTHNRPGVPIRVSHPTTIATLEQLQSKFKTFVTQPRFEGASWGIKVSSLSTGKTLLDYNSATRLSPASNSKLYTAALALTTLGSQYTIKTPLLSTALPDSNQTLHGDLVIQGHGDPSWNFRKTDNNFWSTFQPFITVLKNKHINHITGNIIADSTWLKQPPQGASWTVDDMDYDFGAEISALTLADNYINIRITSTDTINKACTVELLQPLSGLTVDNQTITGPKDSKRDIRVQRILGENILRVSGNLPLGSSPELTEATIPNPSLWFARCLKTALIQAGIVVDGEEKSYRWPSKTVKADYLLGEITSPPLSEMLKSFLKPSQNLETDLIFAQVGESKRTTQTPAWIRTDELAVDALNEYLANIHSPSDAVQFDEGSGLSRNNLTTAAATVNLLSSMSKEAAFSVFYDALPIAGVDGSLVRRMRNTPAQGNLHAKTGGLRWVSSLSGYVTSLSHEKLVFSFILNRHVSTREHRSTDDLDQLSLMLAQFEGSSSK